MELRHLRYFAALAERRNFTRAAEQVHVTQSTLSHQIKQLEDELGVQLFERVGKRVVLTQEGQIFLGSVAKALREIDSGIVTLKESAVAMTGELAVGVTQTFNIRLIPACISIFLTNNPSVHVRIEELPAAAIEQRLIAGTVDIGIAFPPVNTKDLWFEPLFNEELVLAVSEDHPLAARKRVRAVELHRQKLVLLTEDFATRQLLDGCFKSVGAEPLVVAEWNTIAPMLDLVRRMNVTAIASEYAVLGIPGIRAILIESPKPIRTPAILWKRDKPQSPVAKSFAEIVKRTGGTGVAPSLADLDARNNRAALRPTRRLSGKPRS
jgi:LysR family transcriptional regulator, cyn operon transcriptional activator